MNEHDSDSRPVQAVTGSPAPTHPREALTNLRANLQQQGRHLAPDRRAWESAPGCLAHIYWISPRSGVAATPDQMESGPTASSGFKWTLQSRARNLLYRWRAFRHRGLAQSRFTPAGFVARLADRLLLMVLRVASSVRPLLSKILPRQGLAQNILQRIPPPRLRVGRRDSHVLLIQRLADVERQMELLQARMSRYEVSSGSQAVVASPQPRLPMPYATPIQEGPSTDAQDFQELRVVVGGGGFDFRDWEEHTRGEEKAIRDKQSAYLEFLRGCPGPVLDAGCGRGEFLEILRDAGIGAYGIDLDQSMVAHCQAKGLRAEKAELLAHLSQLPEGYLGALFAGQVVEHLPTESLAAFVHLAYRKMASGGTIVLETINPECLTVFSGAFYADPTHTKPVHPKAIEFFLKQAGFGPVTIHPVSPIGVESKLRLLKESGPVDPAIKNLLLQANSNFERLNDVLYKPADYAAVATKP